MVTFEEELNIATGCIGEAEAILNDPSVRAKMKKDSYLGEMTEEAIYKKALDKANIAVEILTRLKWRMLPDALILVDKINNKINPSEKTEIKIPAKKRAYKKKVVK